MYDICVKTFFFFNLIGLQFDTVDVVLWMFYKKEWAFLFCCSCLCCLIFLKKIFLGEGVFCICVCLSSLFKNVLFFICFFLFFGNAWVYNYIHISKQSCILRQLFHKKPPQNSTGYKYLNNFGDKCLKIN